MSRHIAMQIKLNYEKERSQSDFHELLLEFLLSALLELSYRNTSARSLVDQETWLHLLSRIKNLHY